MRQSTVEDPKLYGRAGVHECQYNMLKEAEENEMKMLKRPQQPLPYC